MVYDRYFVGPTGHGLMASLGTVENPWGLKCDDSVVANYIRSQEVVAGNNHACYNETGLRIFIELLKKNPLIYVKAVGKALLSAFFYEIESLVSYTNQSIQDFSGFLKKVKKAFVSGAGIFTLKVLENTSGRLLSLLGYFGLALALFRRRFLPVIFLIGGVFLGMWILLLSHFEERYIVPFAWPFAIFVGYFLEAIFSKIGQVIKSLREKNTCIKKIA